MDTIKPDGNQKKMLSWLAGAGLSIAAVVSGTFLVAPREGKVNGTYVDPVGIVTACYGHTGPELKLGQKFNDIECLNMLAKDLGKEEQYVDKYIKVPLNIYQKAALISWTHNFGPTKLRDSTMAKDFNKGDYIGGCNELTKWVYAGKKKMRGLVTSREKELAFCTGQLEVEGVETN